jgi:pyrroloquinoline-quinone synthase
VSEAIWERIERSRERWNVLRHPFYRRWSAGELTPEELARYSGQYRHAAAAHAPEREDLRRHAAEERGHVRLWDGFIEAAGGDSEARPTPETEDCVRTWTADDGLLETLARLYAIESGQPEISRIKCEGLLDRYGYADGAGTAYFRVHETRDNEHADEVRGLIDELVSDGDADRVVAAAETALRANWRLLDGV